MADRSDLSAYLACPRCDRSPLEVSEAGFRCAGCRVDFPRIDGIPWLFAEPGSALGEWRGRLHFSLQKLEQERARLIDAAKTKGPSTRTQERLERLAAATGEHAGQLRALLEPLAVDSMTASYETHLALRTRLPADQGLTTYYANIHRDWAWGAEENAATAKIIAASIGATAPGRTLVLGAGAGRLAYDFHQSCQPTETVVLDFNPFLMIVAQRITRGETLELYEFPIAPIDIEQQAVLRTLAAEEPADDNLHYVLADAHRPPFAKGSFDTVITPWLIDILPERFEHLCARINTLLTDNGRWINFGSLNFHSPDPALRFSREECVEIVASNGFAAPIVEEHSIPYMCSPASRHGRRERVLSWTAAKRRNAKKAPRHEALPDWLVRGKDPVPLLESFRVQAVSTRVHAFIMSLIDGRRSLADMAQVLESQQLMSSAEAEPTIRTFLMKMYEDSQRGGNY
jgi:uncharacterized protein YbaR (Trm112 family)